MAIRISLKAKGPPRYSLNQWRDILTAAERLMFNISPSGLVGLLFILERKPDLSPVLGYLAVLKPYIQLLYLCDS
jgi:hypothetical protein